MKKRILAIALIAAMVTAALPAAASVAELNAQPELASILVNGEIVEFAVYNIDGVNYFKLRDLAYILSGTEKQFGVGWDSANNALALTRGKPYTVAGGEMAGKGTANKHAAPTGSRLYIDGQEFRFTTYSSDDKEVAYAAHGIEGHEVTYTAYNIDGSNYFRLLDIGRTFDFAVGWDVAAGMVTIDTDRGYEPQTVRDYILYDENDPPGGYVLIRNKYVDIVAFKEYDYSPDFCATIVQCMEWIDAVTGLNSLMQREEVTESHTQGEEPSDPAYTELLEDVDVFEEVSFFSGKIIVFPMSYPVTATEAYDNIVQLTPDYYMVEDYDSVEFGKLLKVFAYVAGTEYSETLRACYPMAEGFAVWAATKAAKENGLDSVYEYNINRYKADVLPIDFEEYFRSGWVNAALFGETSGMKNGRYGYVFYQYLEKTYGEEIIKKIFDEAKKNRFFFGGFAWDDSMSTQLNWIRDSETYMSIIKAVTSEDVFADCAAWFNENNGDIYD